MSTNLVSTSSYQALLQDLSAIVQKGQQSALNAVNEIRLNTYWQLGKRLSEAKELADVSVASSLMGQLASDLNMQLSLLYRIQQFYRLWPDGVPAVGEATLSWSHFVELLSIPDAKKRDFYLQAASTKTWSRDILRKAIQSDLFSTQKTSKKLKKELGLDRPENPLHVYKAVVEKVVDGDTLLVRIDLGFEVWVNQRVRLRGLNTAELIKEGLPAGATPDRAEQAKVFVEEKLQNVEFVVLKTYKTDMYGRYVVDIFYHPTLSQKEEVFSQGFFLNALLLKAGLASLMT